MHLSKILTNFHQMKNFHKTRERSIKKNNKNIRRFFKEF